MAAVRPMQGTIDLDIGFRVDDWEVRPRRGTLARGEIVNRLEPRVMAVLVCLARHAPDVVTREEFVRSVWQGRVVSDEVLSRCISLLRAALDDHTREPQCILTLPRIGYRLVCPVGPLEPAPASAVVEVISPMRVASYPARLKRPRPTPLERRGISPLVIAGMCVVVALPFLLYDWWRPPKPARNPAAVAPHISIAVLPFVDHGGDVEDRYFADGLSEELISRLGAIKGIDVAASTSAFRFKERPADVRKIGQKLDVNYIVEGNVRRDRDRVRIAAQLIDTRSGFHLMSQNYEGRLSDIFALQDAVADGVVEGLSQVLPGIKAQTKVSARRTRSPEAYELVLRGRQQFRLREEDHVRRSIALFEQAIRVDPNYSDAYADLARAQAVLPFYTTEDPEKWFQASFNSLARGAKVDPALANSSQDVVAFVEHSRWHWQAAQDAFNQALALRPTDSNLLQWYSQFLATVGKTRESLRYAQLAKSVDVVSPVVNDRLAVAYMWNDRDDLAATQFDVTRELGIRVAAQPQAYVLLLLRLKHYAEARALLLSLGPPGTLPPAWLDSFLAALANRGNRPAAVRELARAQANRQVPLQVAVGAWMQLGEQERALQGIRQLMHDHRAFEEELLFAREARGVRQLPQFATLLQDMGLVEYWDRNGWPDVCKRVETAIHCT